MDRYVDRPKTFYKIPYCVLGVPKHNMDFFISFSEQKISTGS